MSSGSGKRILQSALSTRVSPAVAAEVRRHAEAAELSDSSWLRQIILNAVGNADVEERQPVARYEPRKLPVPEHIDRLTELREALAEATGALVRSAVFTREGGLAETHAIIESLIPVYRSACLDVDKIKLAYLEAMRTPS